MDEAVQLRGCDAARLAAYRGVHHYAHLPTNVFTVQGAYYFFDPEYLFSRSFPDTIGGVFRVDRAAVLCLLDSDEIAESGRSRHVCISAQTTPEDYMAELNLGGPHGWRPAMHRHTLAPSSAEWILYCDRRKEIGICSVHAPSSGIRSFFAEVNAFQITNPFGLRASQFFDRITPEWLEKLLASYS